LNLSFAHHRRQFISPPPTPRQNQLYGRPGGRRLARCVHPGCSPLLCASLCSCRRASAVTRWAPIFRRWCATSTASAATVRTAGIATRSSTASTCFTTGPRMASALPARCFRPRTGRDRRCSPKSLFGELFRPDNLVSQNAGARHTWANAHHTKAGHGFFCIPL